MWKVARRAASARLCRAASSSRPSRAASAVCAQRCTKDANELFIFETKLVVSVISKTSEIGAQYLDQYILVFLEKCGMGF